MDNFDLRKYLAEGKLLKENIDFPEMEDEFEGAMDAMVVEPEVYLKDILNVSADDLVSDDYYEVMNAVEQGVYSKDEAVKLAKSWAKEKLSTLAEGKLLNENAPGYDTRKTGEALPTLESVKAAYEAKNDIKETLVDADQDMAEAILNALGGEAAFEAVVRAMSTDDAQIYLGGIIRDHGIGMEDEA